MTEFPYRIHRLGNAIMTKEVYRVWPFKVTEVNGYLFFPKQPHENLAVKRMKVRRTWEFRPFGKVL